MTDPTHFAVTARQLIDNLKPEGTDMTTTERLPLEILAALNDPAVCGYRDDNGPCENCVLGITRDLARGVTVAEVLADIERFRQTGERLSANTAA